jgi:hypothetical protein
MRRYRYRTPALQGPWRETREAAVADAIAAGQAERTSGEADGVHWRDGAHLEEQPAPTSFFGPRSS